MLDHVCDARRVHMRETFVPELEIGYASDLGGVGRVDRIDVVESVAKSAGDEDSAAAADVAACTRERDRQFLDVHLAD